MYLVRKYLRAGSIEEAKDREEEALDTNETMLKYATGWYTKRAATGKYDDLLGGDKLKLVLERISKTKPLVESVNGEDGKAHFYSTGNMIGGNDNTRGRHYKGTNMWSAYSLNSRNPTVWHEAIGHLIYDELPWFNNIHSKAPWFYVPGDSRHQNYLNGTDVNGGDEKGANIWGFRGANRGMRDANGNFYIDPNRQLTGKDIKEMRENGAMMPQAFDYMSDDDVAKMHNLYASNRSEKLNNDMFKFA